MENYEILKKLDLNFKIIRLNRHPVDIIYSFYKRGWGKIRRYNVNHNYKYASYTKEIDGTLIPWFLNISKKNIFSIMKLKDVYFQLFQTLKE